MSRGYKTELGHAIRVSTFILLFECGRRPQLHLLSLRLIGHWLRTKKLELASPFVESNSVLIRHGTMLVVFCNLLEKTIDYLTRTHDGYCFKCFW